MSTARSIGGKLLRRLTYYALLAVEFPQWLWFAAQAGSADESKEEADVTAILRRKESHVEGVLREIQGGRFLEIGIGSYPNLQRHRLLDELGIEYCGADLEHVCTLHSSVVTHEGLRPRSFLGNSTGTYVWTLFELAKRGEKYDAVFLDGHHTLYVDLPAMILADRLLRDGGFLMLDDTKWTLAFLRRNLQRSFGEWSFYRRVYNFEEYTAEQQLVPHIAEAAELMLLKPGGFVKVDELSTGEWWTLKKQP